MSKTNKHRCEIIEIYPNEYKMAVQMLSGRVECVQLTDMSYTVGLKGWVTYSMTMRGHLWTFTPFKKELAA